MLNRNGRMLSREEGEGEGDKEGVGEEGEGEGDKEGVGGKRSGN